MAIVAKKAEIEALLRAMEPRLRGLALRCLGRRADVEDLIQEVSVRALAGADGFRGDADRMTWVYRIATNVIADWLRSPFRKRRRPLVDQPDPRGGPAEHAERREERDRVRKAVLALSPEQRLILFLREYEGLRYREIAAILGIPMGTVESRLHAARQGVARELGL